MPDCTPADVRKLDIGGANFPNPPFDNATLANVIACVEPLHDAVVWDTDLVKGCALLAAHFAFKLAKGGNAASGQVVSESAGGLSRSYAAVMQGANDYDLASTPYGIQWMMLRDSQVGGYVPIVLC